MGIKFFLLAGVFPIFGFSQIVLVPNPGFEACNSCPTAGAQWNYCNDWNNVNMNTGIGFWGTPDYFNVCGTGGTQPPATFAGTCSPHTGNAMMAIVVYNGPYPDYREYLQAQLLCPMVPGSTYTLSFWLTNGSGIKSPWTIRNIGVCFSPSPLSQTGYGLINATPQCEITSNVVAPTWTNYTFTVNPTTTWNYITIGSFRSDQLNNPTLSFANPGGPASSYANYFVDDIQVFGPGSGAPVALSSSTGTQVVCAGSSVTLSASGAASYTWLPLSYGSTYVVTPSVTSTYSVYASNLFVGCPTMSTITIPVAPSASLSVSGPTAVCEGALATLTATGVNSYTWNNGSNLPAISITPTATSIFTVSGLAGCGGVQTATIGVSVLPFPSLAVSPSQTICQGNSITLSANGAATYSWSNGATQSAITVTPGITTQYYVTGTSTNGCATTRSVTVHTSECTGIDASNNMPKVVLCPNPFTDAFQLKTVEQVRISLEIFDQNGNVLLSQVVTNGEKILTDILCPGVYYARLGSGVNVTYERIIKLPAQ